MLNRIGAPRIIKAAAITATLALGATAQADIIFSLDQGSLQPAENLEFNCPGLANNAFTVQGCTNVTETIVDISSDETLITTAQGQARIEAADGAYDLAFIRLNDSAMGFGEFEANINIIANASGTATVEACNQSGSFGPADGYVPSGPRERRAVRSVHVRLLERGELLRAVGRRQPGASWRPGDVGRLRHPRSTPDPHWRFRQPRQPDHPRASPDVALRSRPHGGCGQGQEAPHLAPLALVRWW